MDSPPTVGNTTLYLILLYFSSPSVSTVVPSYIILDIDLPAPQWWPGIWRLWITVLLSFTLIFLLPLSFMFSCFTWIETGNENGSPSDVLGVYLDLCGTIIYRLNWNTRSPVTKALLLVMIEYLVVCRDVHENMVLHGIPSPRASETVIGFIFTTKGVL